MSISYTHVSQDAPSSDSTRKVAIYIWDDIIAQIGTPAAHYLPHVMPHLLREITGENPAVRQPAAYGIAVSAQNGGAQFKPLVNGEYVMMLRMCVRCS